MENHKDYIEKIMKRHENLEKELFESGKQIEENNKSVDKVLNELDALFIKKRKVLKMNIINVGLYETSNYPSVTEYVYSTENLSTDAALENAANRFVMTHIGSEIHLYMNEMAEAAMMVLSGCIVWNIPLVFYLRNSKTGEYQSQKML